MLSWLVSISILIEVFSTTKFVKSTSAPVRLRLPSAFGKREVGPAAHLRDVLDALRDVELDAVVEVVLVGQFTVEAVTAVSSALDAEASLRTSSVGEHAYEKVVYHVSAAPRPTILTVSDSIARDSFPDFVAILTDHHRNQGSSLTLFVIELPSKGNARRPWAQAWMDDRSACHGILNSQSEGIAWIFVPSRASYSDKTVSKSLYAFDGAFSLEVAASVQRAVAVLVPSAQAAGAKQTRETHFGVEYLHISICSNYNRMGSCPEDAVVSSALQRISDAVRSATRAAGGGGGVRQSSVSFNAHDHPDLLSAIQSAVYYAPTRGHSPAEYATIDVAQLLRGLMQSTRVRSTLLNKMSMLHASVPKRIIPVFDVYLPSEARVRSRSGRFVEAMAIPFADSGEGGANLILDAIIRVRQTEDDIEGFNIIDYMATTDSCTDGRQVSLSSVGTQLLDTLLQSAFGVPLLTNSTQAEALGEMSVLFVTEDTSKVTTAMKDPYYYDAKNDFRIGRAVSRVVMLQRAESVLIELRSVLKHAAAHFDTLCNATAFGSTMYPVKPDKSIFSVYKDARGAVHEVSKVDTRHYESMANLRRLSCMEMVGFAAHLVDKAADSYSHLEFQAASDLFDSASVVVAALAERSAELVEQSRRATHVTLECFAKEPDVAEDELSGEEEEDEAEAVEDDDVFKMQKQQKKRSTKEALFSALLRSCGWGVVSGVLGFLALKAAALVASAESARAASAESGNNMFSTSSSSLPSHWGSSSSGGAGGAYFTPRKPL